MDENVRDVFERKLVSLGSKWLDGSLKTSIGRYSVVLDAIHNTPIYDMLFEALYNDAKSGSSKIDPIDIILNKINNTDLSLSNIHVYGYIISSSTSLITLQTKLEISSFLVEKEIDDFQGAGMAKVKKLINESDENEQKYFKEKDYNKREDLLKLFNDSKYARDEWMAVHYNSMNLLNKALEFLLKHGAKDDVLKARRFLLQSTYASLPKSRVYYKSLNKEHARIRMVIMQDEKFLNDFFKTNLHRVINYRGVRNDYEKLKDIFKNYENIKSMENIVTFIEDSVFFGIDNVEKILLRYEKELGDFIFKIASEEVKGERK